MLKTIRRYCLYTLYALTGAALYGIITYALIYPLVGEGQFLAAHIANFVIISFYLVTDKITQKLMPKKKGKKTGNWAARVLYELISPRFGRISFKTSLYLFYFCTLIVSVVIRTEVSINITYSFQSYIFIMEYGVLFLVAADMFIKQLVVDGKNIRDLDGED